MDIFGISITRKKKESETKSFAPPTSDDGTSLVQSGGYFGTYVDVEGAVKNEADLIRRYRDIATYPDCDLAIEDIVSETISAMDDEEPVSIVLDDVELSSGIKNKILEEHDEIVRLLGFNTKGHDIFRRWYIDGRLYYHKVIDDTSPKKGIQELRYIDPRKIKKVREVKKEMDERGVPLIKSAEEYFVYSERGLTPGTNGNPNIGVGDFSTKGVRINPDAITYVTSGMIDLDRNVVLSYLHKAIKPVNSLRMMEDALVIYRMSRAPERRIFYIDVGRLPTQKAEQYVKDLMVKYRNKVVYDAQTGEVRDDRKYMCLSMATKVPLLDGRTLSIEEIATEINSGKKLWAYSCDPLTGKFAPGLISWAGVTKKNTQVMRLTLDNGKEIICTPDHKFPVWNKGFVEAQDLVIGESMIPHYTKMQHITGEDSKSRFPYLQIFENDTQKWKYVHRLVSNWKDTNGILNEWVFNQEFASDTKRTVHHINFNKDDNTPDNLIRMTSSDHAKYHSWNLWFRDQIIQGWRPEEREAASKNAKRNNLSVKGNSAKQEQFKDKNSAISKKHTKLYKTEYTKEMFDLLTKYAQSGLSGRKAVELINKEANISQWVELNKEKVGTQKDWSQINISDINRMANYIGAESYSKYKEAMQFRNHKIAKIEYLDDLIDTGCITIDEDERFHNNHTFALDAGIYTKNSMLEDFWLPRQEGGKGTEITTLPGGENLGNIEDVIYFQKKLYQSLNVPVSRLNSDQTAAMFGRQSEVSRDELKFSKFIGRLRKKFSELFSDLLKTNLLLKGIITEQDWDEIESQIRYDFNQDEYYSEVKEAEVLRNRVDLLNQIQPYVGLYYSQEWIRKKILRQTDKEIEQIDKEIQEMEAEQAKEQEKQQQEEEQAAASEQQGLPGPIQPGQAPQQPQ